MEKRAQVHIIGGGLAGCEAAHQAARLGARVVLYEMKPRRYSPAHTSDALCELVCSNSLKAMDLSAASGVLKEEMRLMDSVVIRAALSARVPSGGALAVDRAAFSASVTAALTDAGVEVVRKEITGVPQERPLVIATGPLTSDDFALRIQELAGASSLYFYDAVAPIVYADSIDTDRVFMASRYGKGEPDYLNCPLSKEEYERFTGELLKADSSSAHGFDDIPLFEGCMPIEAMARRGLRTLMFGPMKPVGLIDPKTGARPYAAVQLRRENSQGTLYNIVGFQTRLSFPEQKRVFSLIPGLERARFARFGKLHRNTYMDSPRVLSITQEMKAYPGIFFAGQITGVEGYCESAASGALAGINAARRSLGMDGVCPPETTVTGALMRHVSGSIVTPFQPMNANFGILPPLGGGKADKREKKLLLAGRAVKDFEAWRNLCLASR